MKTLAWMLILISFSAAGKNYFPDPKMTPGSFCDPNAPEFREYRFGTNIPVCNRDVPRSRKSAIYDAYKIPPSERSEYTIDHFYPLSLGGSNEVSNLWPQHKDVGTPEVEYKLYEMARDGIISQEDAIWILKHIKIKK